MATAGWLTRGGTSRYSTRYAPEVRRFAVIDPVPPSGHAPGAHNSHDGPLWRQDPLSAPAYPYGYFGARGRATRWTQLHYYRDYRDAKFEWSH